MLIGVHHETISLQKKRLHNFALFFRNVRNFFPSAAPYVRRWRFMLKIKKIFKTMVIEKVFVFFNFCVDIYGKRNKSIRLKMGNKAKWYFSLLVIFSSYNLWKWKVAWFFISKDPIFSLYFCSVFFIRYFNKKFFFVLGTEKIKLAKKQKNIENSITSKQ